MTRPKSGLCSQCGVLMPSVRKHNYCQPCLNAYRAAWRANHLERDREINRDWNYRHPEVMEATAKRQNEKAKEERRQRRQEAQP